jgi:hypothetical protein
VPSLRELGDTQQGSLCFCELQVAHLSNSLTATVILGLDLLGSHFVNPLLFVSGLSETNHHPGRYLIDTKIAPSV